MSLPANDLQQQLTSLKNSITKFMKLHCNEYDTSQYNDLAKKLQQLELLLDKNLKSDSAGDAPTTPPKQQKMLYEDLAVSKHGQAFVDGIREIGKSIGLKPDYIMATMKAECNFNHKAINPKTGASGLIQFMPKTALGLGTTIKAIRKMTALQQLKYVKKYYKSHGKRVSKITEPAESYLLVFYPYAVGKPDSYVLGSQVSKGRVRKIAEQNGIYDLNNDGEITKGEIMEYMRKHKYKDAYKQLDESGSDDAYVVKSGETLEVIAEKLGVTVDALKAANSDKLKQWGDVQGFNAGVTITVPTKGGATGDSKDNNDSKDKNTNAPSQPEPKSPGNYVVQEGETLELLAEKMKTTVELLKQYNQDKLKKWGSVEGFNMNETVIVPPGGVVPKADSNPSAGDVEDNSGNTGIGDSGHEVYKNQRDNPRLGDTTCNVTTLAMQLIALAGGDEARVKESAVQLLKGYGAKASTSTQLEELLRQLTIKVAGRKMINGTPAWQWSWVLDKTGEKFKDIVARIVNPDEGGLYSIFTKEKYEAKVVPALKEGAEVMLSNKLTKGGHIVFLVAVRNDGIVIHDPYGVMVANHLYIRNGSAIIPKLRNLYNDNPKTVARRLKLNTNLKGKLDEMFTKRRGALPNNMGESNFYTWEEVATYKIGKWCNIAYKA